MNSYDEEIKINGNIFSYRRPYSEGQRMTQAEANILNGHYRRNIQTNFCRIMESMTDQATLDQLRDAFHHYVYSYSLNGVSAVEVEAKAIALAIVKTRIKASGGNIGNFTKAQLTAEADKVLVSAIRDQIFDQATARLRVISAAARGTANLME